LNLTQRYRFIYKPLVFAAALAPLAWMICGVFGYFGASLGADPVKKLEHECGKTALNLLLLTLTVTPLRELTGKPQLLRLRRMLGLFAFFYVVVHFTVYAVLDLELNVHALGADIAKRPYITIGFTALLLLVPLAVTSTNAMMRRLGWRWQRLHRLVYVIAVLGVWHFYWQVKRDVREPLLYVGMLAVLLGYRLLRSYRRRAARAAATPPGPRPPPTAAHTQALRPQAKARGNTDESALGSLAKRAVE
jgi:methionine sulfoxide reductase heme-binding subunit